MITHLPWRLTQSKHPADERLVSKVDERLVSKDLFASRVDERKFVSKHSGI